MKITLDSYVGKLVVSYVKHNYPGHQVADIVQPLPHLRKRKLKVVTASNEVIMVNQGDLR